MEPRRRPLRTYSKRTASTESVEPASKRPCIAGSPKASIPDPGNRISPSDSGHGAATLTHESPLPQPSLPPVKRGTITAYFGRLEPQPPVIVPSSDSLTELSSESNGPTITPPSSPPATTKRKRARRLKTRVVTHRIGETAASSDEEQGNEGSEDERMGKARDGGERPPARSAALSERNLNVPGQNKSISSKSDAEYTSEGRPRDNKKKKKTVPSVQTTLSLSLRETPQYTECGECGMLYNHLHETDVKYHARRHAALRRRAKIRAEDTDTVTTG